jgi:predicted transcriptional regulator
MAEEDTHSVLVRGLPSSSPDARSWRLISDVDLMRALGKNGLNGDASEAAATEIVTIACHERLERAAQVMAEHECSHLLVTAADSELPPGVISSLDVIRGLVWGWRPTSNAAV